MTTRVLYAPRNISGQASEYVAAVAPFGFEGEVWSYGDVAFGFSADRTLDSERLLTDPGHRWEVFDDAVRRFDVFHLQYSRSLLAPQGVVLPELWDLPLLKSLGKQVFMHFRGSDVRLPSVHLRTEPDSYFKDAGLDIDEDRIHARVSICRRYCDAMLVSTPGLLDYVPDAIWVPHVIDVAAWSPSGPRPSRNRPVVAHIPSSRATKGSDAVDPAMRALDADGVVEYRPLHGLAREELRAALQDTDILIDSLTIGDHGLISVEAMAAGAVAVAHIREENRRRNPGCPVVEATVHDVGEVVRRLAEDPQRRAAVAAEGRAWVEARHDRPVVGSLLADLYRRPPRPVELSHPDWPRSETRRRVRELEARVEQLESDVDPLLEGVGPLVRSLPTFVTARLLRRIDELEQALAERDPDHPALRRTGRRALAGAERSWRDRLKEHPSVHRAARRVALALRRRLP